MSLKKKLVEVCHKVYANGFVTAYDGNISCGGNHYTVLAFRLAGCQKQKHDYKKYLPHIVMFIII